MRNVRYEIELYEPMRAWLQRYLTDKYHASHVITIDSHAFTLDKILEQQGIIDEYPQAVGLDIQIDVLGIVKTRAQSKIAFIEAKKTDLNLHDLGQLYIYCKLCNPTEAFLFSSKGLGSLKKMLCTLNREDLLDFDYGKTIKKIIVAKWDIERKSPDFMTMIPKI